MANNIELLNKQAKELIKTEAGQAKLAQLLRPFFKQKMDYMGIARKLLYVDDVSDGAPVFYEKDFPDIPAIKAAHNGTTIFTDLSAERVVLTDADEMELQSMPMVTLKNVFQRTFKVLDRLKVKTEFGLRIKEDLIFFSLLEAAVNLPEGNGTITSTGGFTKRLLNKAISEIEKHRLTASAVICSAKAIADVRSWEYKDTGPVAIQQVLENGYVGKIYGGLDWYVTDQIDLGSVYVVASPEYLGYLPYRTEVEVDPLFLKTQNLIGFKAYVLEAMVITNPYGVAKIEFTPDTNDIYA